jgi:hypothetical protein
VTPSLVPTVVATRDAAAGPAAVEGDGGIGLDPVAVPIDGAEDPGDPVGVEASEGIFWGARIRLDVCDQSDLTAVESPRRPAVS